MNLSRKQKQTHRHREQTRGCQPGRGVEEGWIGGLGLADASYYIQIIYKQQGPTGNYIQYPVINHNGKEYDKEYIYI